MEQQRNHIESLFEKASDYLETNVELIKLKTTEKSSDIMSELISKMILIAIISIFVIMLNIGLGLYLGELLGKTYHGFFVLAGFYGIVGVLCYLFKDKWIEEPVTNVIIKKMTKR